MKQNKEKFFFIALLLMISETFLIFTLQIIYNMNHIAQLNATNQYTASNINSIKNMLQIAAVILVGLSLLIINSNYSVFLQRRKSELEILYNLGFSKKKIVHLLLSEVFILEIITLVIASIIGSVSGFLFIRKYVGSFYVWSSPIICVEIIGGTTLVMYFLIKHTLKTITISKNDIVNEDNGYTADEIRKKIQTFVVCGVLALLCLSDTVPIFENIFDNYGLVIRSGIYWTCILIGLDGFIYLLFKGLEKVSKVRKITCLYIATSQNLFKIKKVNSIISSLFMSVVLLVGLLGFYSSIKASVKVNVDNSFHYDYMVKVDAKDAVKVSNWKAVLDKNQKTDQQYSLVLIDNLMMEGKKFIIIGVDKSFSQICNLNNLIEDGNVLGANRIDAGLNVIIPIKKARDNGWKTDDILNAKIGNSEELQVGIEAVYKAVDLNAIYTSRQELSRLKYVETDFCNAIYFQNYTKLDIEAIMSKLRIDRYDIESIGDLTLKGMNQAVNGTEIIEAYVYVFLFYTTSLIINLFIISHQERIQDYSTLLICGVKKKTLVNSMFLESTLIFLIGSVLGWICGESFIDGALILMKQDIVIDTIKVVPYSRISMIVCICFVILNVSILLLSNMIISKTDLKVDYKD